MPTAEDFYAELGCDPTATTEQISAEFRALVVRCHPDKSGGSDDQFKRLQRAKEVLTDVHRRKDYDSWRNSGISITFDEWLTHKSIVHMARHWSEDKPVQQAITKDVGEMRKDKIVPGVTWERDSTPLLQQFRNYQI